MGTKRCPICGNYIDVTAVFCPNCGSFLNDNGQPQIQQQFDQQPGQPQGMPQQMQQPVQQYRPTYDYQPQNTNRMSTNKILSIVAIALAVLGNFCGAFIFEIGALALSIIVLTSGQYKEKEAVTLAKISLVLVGISFVFWIIYFIVVGAAFMHSVPVDVDIMTKSF